MTGDLDRARAILRAACGDRLREGVVMAPLTTFRIGGRAALYLEPQTDADLAAAGEAIGLAAIPFTVLGKGSNVIVADEGFPGLILRLGKGYRWVARAGDVVTAGGAMPLPALAGVALQHALEGIAFAVAIPASLGGAIRMNAGAHGGQMSDVTEGVSVFRLLQGVRDEIPANALGFAYRHSGLPRDAVVAAATLRLRPGDRDEIRVAMDDARRWRRDTQPIAEPNCGSIFTNPPGHYAAALIDSAGLKGARIGGARVSTKHANFIVTEPGASAADVVALIAHIQSRVQASAGVHLEPEVQVIGPVGG